MSKKKRPKRIKVEAIEPFVEQLAVLSIQLKYVMEAEAAKDCQPSLVLIRGGKK